MRRDFNHPLGLIIFQAVLVVAMPHIGLGEVLRCSPASAIANGEMGVCWKPSTESSLNHLLIHFHGAPEVVKAAFAKSDLKAVLVIINFPGLSSAYSRPFAIDGQLFQQILEDTKQAVIGTDPNGKIQDWQRVSVSSFSAGYGAVREILKSPAYFQRIDAIVAADSIYAGLQKKNGQNVRSMNRTCVTF